MKLMEGALEAFEEIAQLSDAYILSTAPWNNPSAWSDKLLWVQKHLKESSYKRLILSHHKNLNRGDILIDDRKKNGADKFKGIFIHFGSEQFPHWKRVKKYVLTLL